MRTLLGLFLLAVVASAQAPNTTPNLHLYLPIHGSTNWDTWVNSNWSTLDTAISSVTSRPGGVVNNSPNPFNYPPLGTLGLFAKQESGAAYTTGNTAEALSVFENFQGAAGTPWAIYSGLAIPSTLTSSAGYASISAYTYTDSNQIGFGVHGECDRGPLTANQINIGDTVDSMPGICAAVNAEAQSNSNAGQIIGFNTVVGNTSLGNGFVETGLKIAMNYPGSAGNASLDGDGAEIVTGSGVNNAGVLVNEVGGRFNYAIETISSASPVTNWMMWNAYPGNGPGHAAVLNFARGAEGVPHVQGYVGADTLSGAGLVDGFLSFGTSVGGATLEDARFTNGGNFLIGSGKTGLQTTSFAVEIVRSDVAGTFRLFDQTPGGATSQTIREGGSQGIVSPFSVQSNTGTPLFQILNTGQPFVSQFVTGSGVASLGGNFPGAAAGAPYTWLKVTASDGTQLFVPAWR